MPSLVFDEMVGVERIRAEITSPDSYTKPSILMLHGAGKAVRGRTKYLADHLVSMGHASLRFDFSGHGESSGRMEENSLNKRLEQALAMRTYLESGPLTLIGNSMGGHTVVRLLEYLPVDRLILFCPAAYSQQAEPLLFNDKFTEEIRKPESWKNSPIWPILENYRGKAMFVIGAHDDVIPEGIVARYLSSLRNCQVLEYIKVPEAPHLIHPWLEQNTGPREDFFKRLASFMVT